MYTCMTLTNSCFFFIYQAGMHIYARASATGKRVQVRRKGVGDSSLSLLHLESNLNVNEARILPLTSFKIPSVQHGSQEPRHRHA